MSSIKLALLFLGLTVISFQKVFAQDKPNILLMMTDDQGYGDLSLHGNPFLKTPNLDALAKESVEFTRFYVNTLCTPTRASLMTGRDYYRTGATGVTEAAHMMDTGEKTIAELLADAGYHTGIFGKWHLGDHYPMRPTDQGFQEALVHKAGGIGQAAGPPGNTYFDPILEHNNESKKYQGYCDDIFTDAAIDFIEAKNEQDQPFFTYLATNLPHFPLQVSDEMADPYREMGLHEDNARTYGMIANIDKNVGRVLEKLEELGVEENTIVIFLTDNGPRTRRTRNDRYPGRWVDGLRGTKTSMYENGIKVPFFIRWPSRFSGGRKTNELASHIDVLPTLLDAANVEQPDVEIDGISLLPFLEGEQAGLPDRELYLQWHEGGPLPFKYVHFTVITDRYKLIQPQDKPHDNVYQPSNDKLQDMLSSLELYDIKKDPSERNNIAGQHPDIVDKMLTKYENWFSEVTGSKHHDKAQRIYLGTKHQPFARLSRFSWESPRTLAGSPQLGNWAVHTEEGNYRITLRFPEVQKEGLARIRYGDVQAQNPIERGDTESVFNNITLPEKKGELEAFLKLDRLPIGVRFVEVERMD